MKNLFVLLMFLIPVSCARKVDVRAPQIINGDRFSYTKGKDGRLYIVTATTKDFEDTMKKLHPGPSSVDKLDIWVLTPLGQKH
jgi:hypothetical protein